MAKSKAKRKTNPVDKHVRLFRWLLNSEAYRSLSVGARATLIELYDLYNGLNNGEIFLSVREAGLRLQVNKDTAGGWLWDLECRGFIKPNVPGAFSWKDKHASTWILTEFGFANQLSTKDFMRWKPGDSFATRPRPGGPTKIKTRSEKSGRLVRPFRTAKSQQSSNGPENSDVSVWDKPFLGPDSTDTGSLP